MATETVAGEGRVHRRELVAVVTSDKMDKTRVVIVTRRVKDLAFKKYVNKRAKFKAHDEKNEAKVGDKVLIYETKPISKDKKWKLGKILSRGVEV